MDYWLSLARYPPPEKREHFLCLWRPKMTHANLLAQTWFPWCAGMVKGIYVHIQKPPREVLSKGRTPGTDDCLRWPVSHLCRDLCQVLSLSLMLVGGSSLASAVASLWSAEWLNPPRDSLCSFPLYPQHPGLLQAAGVGSMDDTVAGQRLDFSRDHLQLQNSAPSDSVISDHQ